MSKNLDLLTLELKNPEKEIRLNALKEVFRLGYLAVPLVDLVKNNLKDKDEHIRKEAALALYALTGNSMICFEEIFLGLESEVSDSAKECFSFIISEKVKKNSDLPVLEAYIDNLIEVAENLDAYSKKQFCYAFGHIKNKKTKKIIDFLISCAKSPIIDLKLVAIEAITKLENNCDSLLGEIIEKECDEAVKLKILNYNNMRENNHEPRKISRRTCQKSL